MLPESPRYLLLKGKDAAARKALSTLTKRPADSAEVDEECLDITLALEAERAMGKTTYLDCFRNNESRNGFRTWTGIWIQGWQQLSEFSRAERKARAQLVLTTPPRLSSTRT